MTPGMWTVSIAFTLASIIGLGLNLIPAYRRSRVRTLGTSVGLAVPDVLATPLSDRLTRRSIISWIGSLIGLAAVVSAVELGFIVPTGDESGAADLWVVFGGIVIGVSAGAIVNALTLKSVLPAGERFARSTAVRIDDYLSPIDLVGSRIAAGIGAVALVAWILVTATGLIAPDPVVTVGVVVTALSVISLFAFELAIRSILDRGQPVASPAELAWDDALRGMSMRSIASAPMCLGIWGALAVCIDLAQVPAADPAVGGAASVIAIGAGVVIFVGIVIAAIASIATKPQQQYLRRLWPEVAAAQPVKAA